MVTFLQVDLEIRNIQDFKKTIKYKEKEHNEKEKINLILKKIIELDESDVSFQRKIGQLLNKGSCCCLKACSCCCPASVIEVNDEKQTGASPEDIHIIELKDC